MADWSLEYAEANVALRADGWIGIDVDAYDGKRGAETLAALEAELGELPTTISSTSRGRDQPSRIWLYRVPRDLHFVTRFDGIEIIQYSHRYAVVAPSIHPDTGRAYEWFGYEGEPLDEFPSLDDLEELPEAWLNRLAVPDEAHPGNLEGFAGSVAEWLERAPKGEPGIFMQSRMAEIPVDQDFGHDQMISLCASFVSQAAQGETGAERALETLRREWLRGQYDTPEYRRDFETALKGAIEKYGAMPPKPSDILEQDQTLAFRKVTYPDFLDMWTGVPAIATPEALREHVGHVIEAALTSGLSFLEATTLGWHSAAAQASGGLQGDGLEALWAFASEVQGRMLDAPAAEPQNPQQPAQSFLGLLTDEERERANAVKWWGSEFIDRMRELHKGLLSEPYYRLGRWIILSLAFADKAFIPLDNGDDVILNFYTMKIGPTRSGKSQSTKPILEMSKLMGERFWLMDGKYNPDIGGNATPAALHTHLIMRDGKPTFFHADEADATLRLWNDEKGPFSGVKRFITDVWMGYVGAILRQGQKDISGQDAKAFLNVELAGIDREVSDVIEPRDWSSGFINRFVWAKGERLKPTREQKRVGTGGRDEASKQVSKQWYAQWVSQFAAIRERELQKPEISISPEVSDRHIDLRDRFELIADASPYAERLEPTFGRLETTILKCAALVAITQKRRRIELEDYLVALLQAEEWAETIVEMVIATDETPRARKVNRLYELIASRQGGMRMTELMREKWLESDHRFAKGLVEELVAQGRVETGPLTGERGLRVWAAKE